MVRVVRRRQLRDGERGGDGDGAEGKTGEAQEADVMHSCYCGLGVKIGLMAFGSEDHGCLV